MNPERRGFLRQLSVVIAGASLAKPFELLAGPEPPRAVPGFTHRGYNGWITDLATDPDPSASWPSMRLDQPLLEDYRRTFILMKRLGFNEIVIWGLYVANNWPVDIPAAVKPERGKLVERLVAEAHRHGIKVLSGLGTYSWGFAEIIKANPQLSGGNPNAMCASQPEAHECMRRIVDFVFNRFDIDGVSMQSADQGRCKCANCSKLGDAEYHAALIIRTAEYIRSRWSKKVLGMSNWGVPFNRREDREHFVRMSRALDYMIDQNDSAFWGGRDYRREFIAGLDCALGTTGGPVVEPPQHWARDRWFLPTCRRVKAHLERLAQDGGHACEFFYHILANPGSELTFHVAGRALKSPGMSLEEGLRDTIDELYAPRDSASHDGLAQFVLAAEDTYMRHLPPAECGTISLEPLVSDKAGPPVYIRDRLKPSQRQEYARDLERLSIEFEKLRPGLGSKNRTASVGRCLANALADARSVA